MERLSTGVAGLDTKMEGGFYQGSVNLVTGKTGTGKSTLSHSFLYAGALKKEPGLYVTTEERDVDLKADIKSMFGWDMDALEKKKLLRYVSLKPVFPGKNVSAHDMNRLIKLYIYDIADKIEKGVKAIKAKRVVIDSASIIEMFIKDEYLSRTVLMYMVDKLKTLGTTALFTGTVSETSEGLSGGGIIEFLVDGIIKLDFVPVAEEFKRTLTIRKMRRTDHSVLIHPFDIGKKGMKLVSIK